MPSPHNHPLRVPAKNGWPHRTEHRRQASPSNSQNGHIDRPGSPRYGCLSVNAFGKQGLSLCSAFSAPRSASFLSELKGDHIIRLQCRRQTGRAQPSDSRSRGSWWRQSSRHRSAPRRRRDSCRLFMPCSVHPSALSRPFDIRSIRSPLWLPLPAVPLFLLRLFFCLLLQLLATAF